MKRDKSPDKKFKVKGTEALNMVLRYIRQKISEQIMAVATIIIYLLLFQTIILGIPVFDAAILALGMGLVIVGLAFFLEGLLIGIMPMSEEIGIKLPQKAGLATILIIGFILGVGATFAEPAIGVLKAAGRSVLAWEAPLLFLFLNKYSSSLVNAVGIGVGIALILSMLRFLKGWSLKPYIYILVSLLLGLSLYSYLDPNLRFVLGLAWDCGGVTTGPVTVPLVLALGIGISHVAHKGGSNAEGGFGVVTLASLVPIITVILLGIFFSFSVPQPMEDTEFFDPSNAKTQFLFESSDKMKDYAISNASYEAQLTLFDSDEQALMTYIGELGKDEVRIREIFGDYKAFQAWLINNGSPELKQQYVHLLDSAAFAVEHPSGALNQLNFAELVRRNIMNSLRAIVPLSAFLLFVLYFVLRSRLHRADEVFLGLAFALIGLAIFGGGIELGLSKLGDQVGSNLPSSFSAMEMPANQQIIRNFDEDMINTAIRQDGSSDRFFFLHKGKHIEQVPFDEWNYDAEQRIYRYVPVRGPLVGKREYSFAGILLVLIFAFIMGYSATLAEPALNALGITVEDVTVGAFKKSTLIQAVAVGVGTGILLGMAKIIWDLPLFWILAPLYALLLIITKLSTEEFVNIGWDSAGVTTGPITVPLVLSMGLGIGTQVGVVEGFGVLSLASVCPILSVLSMGMYVNHKRRAVLKELEQDEAEMMAEELAL
ncbi:MAG: DUF1538 domain-containing protein [Candidatus Cloacimonetes bacterium]|nr:DUF1538 domain-containing protein [Candidatus Cloacimonadota bacterium]